MIRPQLERAGTDSVRNVGGSDYVTRVIACLAITGLLYFVIPVAGVPWSLLKIALLTGAELGVVLLMVGLFFRAKTYFAGAQLFFTALVMLYLAGHGLGWVALGLGALSVVAGAIDLITRKSRFNALVGLSSWREAPKAPPTTPHPHAVASH